MELLRIGWAAVAATVTSFGTTLLAVLVGLFIWVFTVVSGSRKLHPSLREAIVKATWIDQIGRAGLLFTGAWLLVFLWHAYSIVATNAAMPSSTD